MPLVLLLAAALTPTAPVPKMKAQRPDAEVFVGVWEAVTPNRVGQMWGKATWTIDDKLELRIAYPEEDGRSTTWELKLATDRSPKEIEIGKSKGIYEIDGETIRVAYSSGSRPSGFDPADGVSLHVLRRVESKGDK